MNIQRMRELADVIEKSETYDQTIYVNDCGTPACIAGHAVAHFAGHNNLVSPSESIANRAQKLLDLTWVQVELLFNAYPDWSSSTMPTTKMSATKEEAAAELRRMADQEEKRLLEEHERLMERDIDNQRSREVEYLNKMMEVSTWR